MRSHNLLSISIMEDYSLTIRLYGDRHWGWRRLGEQRYALDLGYISLVAVWRV